MFFWNSLILLFNYGWIFNSCKSSTKHALSSTGHPLCASLRAYVVWGKNPNSSRYQKKKATGEIESCCFNMPLAELPACVSECRKMLQLVYCDRALIFLPRTVDHPEITLPRMYWVRTHYADLQHQESALTNEQNSKKKTRSDSSLILNGVT